MCSFFAHSDVTEMLGTYIITHWTLCFTPYLFFFSTYKLGIYPTCWYQSPNQSFVRVGVKPPGRFAAGGGYKPLLVKEQWKNAWNLENGYTRNAPELQNLLSFFLPTKIFSTDSHCHLGCGLYSVFFLHAASFKAVSFCFTYFAQNDGFPFQLISRGKPLKSLESDRQRQLKDAKPNQPQWNQHVSIKSAGNEHERRQKNKRRQDKKGVR